MRFQGTSRGSRGVSGGLNGHQEDQRELLRGSEDVLRRPLEGSGVFLVDSSKFQGSFGRFRRI